MVEASSTVSRLYSCHVMIIALLVHLLLLSNEFVSFANAFVVVLPSQSSNKYPNVFSDRISTSIVSVVETRRHGCCCCFAEKPKWLADAMEEEEEDSRQISLTPGLSGFCLDDKMGFVAIISDKDQFVATTVSLQDRGSDRVVSPEALTMVQLAGGLDLGMAMLPPDALLQLVLSELVDDDDDDDDDQNRDTKNVPLVSLTGVRAVPNEHYKTPIDRTNDVASPNDDNDNDDDDDNKERNEAIQKSLPQVYNAIKGLVGLQQVKEEQVLAALKLHANKEDGTLDRQGFSNLLDQLRRGLTTSISSTDKKVKFVLDVNLVKQDSIQNLSIDTLDTFRALGLSMRHKIPLQVDPECLEYENNRILEEFPAFRPMQELYEDAQIMDGVIPSMFENAKLQQRPRPPPSTTDES